MSELATKGAADSGSRLKIISSLRVGNAVSPFPVSHRDVEADTRYAAASLARLGVAEGAMVLLTSGSSEYAQFWPYELAIAAVGACVAVADNMFFDAGRSEMFMRRLPIDVAFAITTTVLDGMESMNIDIASAFGSVKTICARDAAADRLARLGFAPWRMVSFGPTFGYISPEGETFHDRDEWLIEERGGELTITALNARALPLVRLAIGVRGSVDQDHRFTLA